MDAREVAEANSEGINRVYWLIDHDANDDETKADIQRFIDALYELKSSTTITTSFRPSEELFEDLLAIRGDLDARQLSPDELLLRIRRVCAAFGVLIS